MGMLNIYYGRESVDKEKFIFDRIQEISAGAEPSALLLVPDQFTLQAERDAFAYLGVRGMMNTEVITMSRLGFRVLAELGGGRQDYIDKYGRHMLLAKLVAELGDGLQVYGDTAQKSSFIEMANNLISEMKQFNTSPEVLAEIINAIEEDSLLKRKLMDVALIYQGYEDGIAGKYVDTEDYINFFLPRISQAKLVCGRQIWVYGFDYFAPQSMDILAALMGAAHVNVVLTYGTAAADEDIFSLTGGIIQRLEKIAGEIGAECRKAEIGEEYLRQVAPAIWAVEKNVYALPFQPVEREDCSESITLIQAANPYAEAETAAAYILALVRDKGLRYKDIVVACNDMETRGVIVKRVFEEFGIELFMDQKRGILHSPAIAFVVSLVRIAVLGRRNEDILKLLKTGLTDIDQERCEELENYVIKYRIKGGRWKQDFEKGKTEYSEEELCRLNETRNQVMNFITAFESEFKKGRGTEERVRALYEFLADTAGLPGKLEAQIEELGREGRQELADETAQIWSVLVNILEQLAALLGSEKISGAAFADILQAGMESVEIGLLPPAVDGLIMGTMQRTRVGGISALVVLGANDGVLPAELQADGLLNDDEKILLLEKGAELCKLDDLRAMEERMAIYKALSKPSGYLYMSYSISDAEGKELRPSSVFEKIERIFPAVSVKADILNRGDDMALIQARGNGLKHMSGALRESLDGAPLADCWKDALAWYQKNDAPAASLLEEGIFYTNKMNKLSEGAIERLLKREDGQSLVVSPSALEKYSRCPFAYFINYGMRPDERRIFEMASREIGDVYHSCLMKLSMMLTDQGVAVTAPDSQWMTVEREAVDSAVKTLISQEAGQYREGVLNYGKEEQYRVGRMEQICSDMAWILIEQVRQGRIKAIGFETQFGAAANKPMPPIEVKVAGKALYIEGKVDRVDILDGNAVKIIDYKSGREKFDIDEARAGWRLQLMLYLKAAQSDKASDEKRKPAGVFYFKIEEPLIDAVAIDKAALKEKVSGEIRKTFKLDGVMVDEPGIIQSIAGEFTGYSDIAQIRSTSEGIKGTGEGRLLSGEEFAALQRAVDEKVEELCKSLLDGEINAQPKKSKDVTACQYCKYKGICRFDTALEGCKYQLI